jgi:hypothetical protein
MKHCPVTGEPVATCDCGACDDEPDETAPDPRSIQFLAPDFGQDAC